MWVYLLVVLAERRNLYYFKLKINTTLKPNSYIFPLDGATEDNLEIKQYNNSLNKNNKSYCLKVPKKVISQFSIREASK